MEVSESETRQELEANALDFLKAVAIEAKTKLGSDLEWSRTSYWLVPIGSGRGCHGQTSTRIIINRSNINIVYRKMMKTGFPEKTKRCLIPIRHFY